MKKKNGFTLIELLAVVVILGVLMLVAIPNVVSTLEKNKRDSFINDAKLAISAAEYTIRANTQYEYPKEGEIVIFPFNKLRNLNIEKSSFDTYYSYDYSFVAITREEFNNGVGDSEYVYYVHLVSCTNKNCDSTDTDEIDSYRGINLTRESNLETSKRFDLVTKGFEVQTDLLTRDTRDHDIKEAISNSHTSEDSYIGSNYSNVIVY
ncbi:MAG: type II secretion system protein [Bacilli bacterium]|nr:type II secretion system protein [Bacilli bacterium]